MKHRRRRTTAHEELQKGNVEFKCPEHISRPDPQWADHDPEWFIGRSVKKAFSAIDPDGGRTYEHMWVKVARVQRGLLVGRLENAPVYQCAVAPGDWVKVRLSEIEAVYHG